MNQKSKELNVNLNPIVTKSKFKKKNTAETFKKSLKNTWRSKMRYHIRFDEFSVE